MFYRFNFTMCVVSSCQAMWVLRCEMEAVEVVKRMEARGGDRVSLHTFNCPEAVHHHEGYQEVAQVMLDEKAKPTNQRVEQTPHFW